MDWSKIKTIFILTFLLLDVYLMYQYLIIRDANKYEIITEASFEDRLKADEIEFVPFPKQPIKDQYVSAKPKTFSKEDVAKLKGQTVTIVEGNELRAIFDKPIPVPSKNEKDEWMDLLKEQILNGDDYHFWKMSDKKDSVIFYQEYKDKPFYENINGRITLKLDEQNRVVSYEQTYLEGIEELTGKDEVLSPLKAIETLHQKGLLKPKSKITQYELGYSTAVQLAASQVLTPTWLFVINDEKRLFVNAFEGQIIENFNSEENKVTE